MIAVRRRKRAPALLAIWVGEYTRFAAGAFILISGLSVGRVFSAALLGPAPVVSAACGRLLRRPA